jgi:hypothetical protein
VTTRTLRWIYRSRRLGYQLSPDEGDEDVMGDRDDDDPGDDDEGEAVVPRKRPNKGRQLPAEVVEGRASPEGNSRQAAVVPTLSRDTTSIRLAAVRRSASGQIPLRHHRDR